VDDAVTRGIDEAPACRPQISAASWQRVQLVLHVDGGLDAGGRTAGQQFHLAPSPVHSSLPSGSVRASGTSREGEQLIVRFNVMCGPGKMPLAPGTWHLVVTSDAEAAPRPVSLAGPARSMMPELGRDFDLGRSVYRARPAVDHATDGLVLRISLRAQRQPRLPLEEATAAAVRRAVSRSRRRAFLWVVSLIRRVVRHNGRRIVFTSDSRGEIGGNLKIIRDRMIARGLHRQRDLITIFKPSITARRSLPDRLRLAWLLAVADVILLDDYQPAIYSIDYPADTRVIQVWHAWGAFKTVGYSRVGKPGGLNPYSRVHKTYTHATVSSEYEVPFYAEAFCLPEDRVVPTGVPRMDTFLDPQRRSRGREAALAAVPAARSARTILFAPTFRGAGARQATYDIDQLDLAALHEVCVAKDAIVLFKMHPFVKERLAIPPDLQDRLISASDVPVDVNDLLLISDVLITDYSSILFEFATLQRPMLFFAYDLDEYTAERDFYVPYAEFVPGRIVRTFAELLDALRHDDYQSEKLPAFAERHFPRLDGSATDRIIDQLILAR
jgi:CDP-ribitol ribitolphosphotransferase